MAQKLGLKRQFHALVSKLWRTCLESCNDTSIFAEMDYAKATKANEAHHKEVLELWKRLAPDACGAALLVVAGCENKKSARMAPHVSWCVVWGMSPKAVVFLGINSAFHGDWCWFFTNVGAFNMANYSKRGDVFTWKTGTKLQREYILIKGHVLAVMCGLKYLGEEYSK